MTVMPGAVWRPIPVSRSRPLRRKGRGVILHVAASEATSLFGFFSTASVDSHFYVAKDGAIEQYVDTDLQAYASMDGNATTISVETQGGVANPDGEPWTPQQVASLARICRWANEDEGVPLQVMPDSRPASRGIGWHRLGVRPWVVPGGEIWSAANGKRCPGDAKIAQVPAVVAAARGNPTPTATVRPEEHMHLIQQTDRGIGVVGPGYYLTLRPDQVNPARAVWGEPTIFATAAEYDTAVTVATAAGNLGKLTTAYDLSGRPSDGPDDLFGHVMNTEALARAMVKALAALADQPGSPAAAPAVPSSDLADLARQIGAQLASDKGFLTALAAAVNEDAARRLAQ